jgi:N-formylglutamate amidohydrolase
VIAFDLFAAAGASPVVVEVPHAGLDVPPDLSEPSIATDEQRRRDADLFVDRLYASAPAHGAPLLVARVSRYVCDLNRDPEDVDALAVSDLPNPRPSAPRGFVWRLTTEGAPALSRPLAEGEWRARRDRVWAPYHDRLAALLEAARAAHGFAVLISGHSMPSVGRAGHSDRGRRRADVVVGVRGGTSCAGAIRDLVSGHFSSRGYSVAIDDPYRGGATTERYGRPSESLHAVQIEVARALYMDEDRCAIRDDGLGRLSADVDDLIRALAGLSPP